MDKSKIHFIEEAKIKREFEIQAQRGFTIPPEALEVQSNPIRTNLMKFVNFKQKNKFTPKDLF